MKSQINNKKIELFVDNGIDNYRKGEETTVGELLRTYFDNEGFFVLGDEGKKPKGYIDSSDIMQITAIIDASEEETVDYMNDTIKALINKDLINLREDFIDSNEKLIEVIEKLNNSNQTYFPVLKKDILIGRVSKKLLREKIKDLY
jgi:CBS domain-containing protein